MFMPLAKYQLSAIELRLSALQAGLRTSNWWLCLFAGLLVLLAIVTWLQRPQLALLWQEHNADESVRQVALWLPDYRVDIEAKPLPGVDNLSGLTFDPVRGSLFAITNANPEILELSRDGNLLRRIPLDGLVDPEAIEYVGNGDFVLADERSQTLVAVHIDDSTRRIDTAAGMQLSLGLGLNGNKGFEGLAWDATAKRLFVAKERDPQQIFEIQGFPFADESRLRINETPHRDAALPGTDLSSLVFEPRHGHLLVLSEESRLLVEFSDAGQVVSRLSLAAGRGGLKRAIPQAEGVALDDERNLYLVSEPNLFYRFTRTPAASFPE